MATADKASPRAGRDGPNRRVVEVETAPVAECRSCRGGLAGVDPTGRGRRVRVDLVFETRELTVEAEIKTCPRCRAGNRGRFPADMPGPLQYGHGAVAFATHLPAARMVPPERAAQTLKAPAGRAVAEATPPAWPPRPHRAPAGREAAAVRRLLESPAPHADETGLRIGRKNHWPHSHGAGDPALKFVHRKRGRAAIDELNVIPRHGGVLVHDRRASHFGYENRGHALCGAHLPRDPAFVEDAHGHNPLSAIQIALNGNAATMVGNPTRNNPDNQTPGGE